jgi:hypothetical protein
MLNRPTDHLMIGVWVLAGWLSTAFAAETAPGNPASAPVWQGKVASITEHRGSPGRCNLLLEFADDRLANRLSIFRAHVTRAVDDTGADLRLPEAPGFLGAGSGSQTLAAVQGWQELQSGKKRYVSLQLTNAVRRATAIAEISGELELFAPTLQNGGVLTIEGFRREPGHPLKHPRLERMGVTLTCFTKETYESAKAAGRARSKSGFVDPAEQQIDGLFPGILGDASAGRNYVVLKVDDPQRRITSFAFGEPGGRLFPVVHRRSSNSMFGFYFPTAVPEDLVLYVYVAVPEALETVPFQVRSVPLP